MFQQRHPFPYVFLVMRLFVCVQWAYWGIIKRKKIRIIVYLLLHWLSNSCSCSLTSVLTLRKTSSGVLSHWNLTNDKIKANCQSMRLQLCSILTRNCVCCFSSSSTLSNLLVMYVSYWLNCPIIPAAIARSSVIMGNLIKVLVENSNFSNIVLEFVNLFYWTTTPF